MPNTHYADQIIKLLAENDILVVAMQLFNLTIK